jgi:acetyl-CoA carboxylase alpha subunit
MGQGAGGAALALLPADRVIAAENSWLSALSPEGASALRYRTSTRAADIAASMDISAHALLRDGIADEVISEETDAATRPALFLHSLGSAIETGLCNLLAQEATQRNMHRTRRYQALDRPGGTTPRD